MRAKSGSREQEGDSRHRRHGIRTRSQGEADRADAELVREKTIEGSRTATSRRDAAIVIELKRGEVPRCAQQPLQAHAAAAELRIIMLPSRGGRG